MCSWTEEGLTPRIGRSLCSLILCPGAMVEILRIRGSFRPGAAVSSETSLQGFITCSGNLCRDSKSDRRNKGMFSVSEIVLNVCFSREVDEKQQSHHSFHFSLKKLNYKMRCDVIGKQRGQWAGCRHYFLEAQGRENHIVSGENFPPCFI